MSSTMVAPHEYWGYLIKADKNPTPVFEQLLYGLANYINHHVAPWDTHCLTPAKLATFYRLVGGDFDPFFLDTSQASLSFIYASLGCFHTLQPEQDPHTAPSVPALTPSGFVRWQTVQLLLEPEEHVPFLQSAVKRFDILNPSDGRPFPSILPKEALPTRPDPDISEWHSKVSERLMLEAQASAARNMPPRPQMALSDIDLESSVDCSVDSGSVAGTDMSGYFAGARVSARSPQYRDPRAPHILPPYSHEAPWSPERRRSSFPDNDRDYAASWPRDRPAPTSFSPPLRNTHPHPHHHHHHHQRADSDLSTVSTSTSDTSSLTASSASLSPIRHRSGSRRPRSPIARTQSSSLPPRRSASHAQEYLRPQRESFGPSSNAKSVRWQDMDDIFDGPRYSPNRRGQTRQDSEYGNGNGRIDEQARGRPARDTGPNTGVGGRRYADGLKWI